MEYIPANANNYLKGRKGKKPEYIVIHTVVGSQKSCIATFLNPTRNASAHYIVDYDTDRIVQMVKDDDTAYHAGNFNINLTSIGIEHADNLKYNDPRPEILYKTSSKLVASLCAKYNIPCNREHIKAHREVSLRPTACPDALDVDKVVKMAQEQLNPTPPMPTPPEWQVKLKPIGSHTNQMDSDIPLVDFVKGKEIREYKKGTTITVHYETNWQGQRWYLTEFSGQNRIPNGFLASDFDSVEPVIPPPPPVEPTPPVTPPTPPVIPPPVVTPPVEPIPPYVPPPPIIIHPIPPVVEPPHETPPPFYIDVYIKGIIRTLIECIKSFFKR